VILTVGGATVTVATGTGIPVTLAVPLFPSADAVITAVPKPAAVTTPVCDTVAKLVLLEFQVTGRPVRTFPLASVSVAVRVVVDPITTLAEVGAIVTEFTGAIVTVTVVVAVFVSLVAVIVADPAATAVMRPADDTVATAGALVVHVTTRPVTTVPLASFTVTAGVAV
jgi:hypothetical protein